MEKAIKLPNTEQAKGITTLVIMVVIIILVVVFAKKIGDLFGGLFKSTSQGLGLSNSDDKENVNNVFNAGTSPLFSYTFPKMQKDPHAVGAPLLTVAAVHDLINKLQGYRGVFFDDSEKAVGLFASLGTQYKVAWFAYRFQIETGSELFNWLRKSDTLFSQGFDAATVNSIINTVSHLPVWK